MTRKYSKRRCQRMFEMYDGTSSPCCGFLRRSYDGKGEPAWECTNCGDITPRRVVKAGGRLTKSQRRVIDNVHERFGGIVKEVKFHGRRAWVVFDNEQRSAFDGTMMFGSVGPNGAYEFTLPRMYAGDVKITDAIGLTVYVGR